ncbi:hypothetical protein HB852_12410 [Listeria grandensis]|uniref:hypothetical protein n=1 Tax=Listeria grandensis TaxID=1494963 RepID=UPI0016264F6E|nr:hypothetical protein [Listeria grandensis]MBC1475416.1 hypothetical protein [Listeria grandensis]
MDEIVLETIGRVYKNKDYEFFKKKSEEELVILDDLVKLIDIGDVIVGAQEVEPSVRVYIDYPNFKKGEMEVSYSTSIDISKIIPVYYVQHEFAVENIDENRMGPVLDGFDGQPYIINQANLYDKVSSFLNKNGYFELSYAEMNIAIPSIKMPEDIWLFGPQFTVRTCLFNDILNICEIDD